MQGRCATRSYVVIAVQRHDAQRAVSTQAMSEPPRALVFESVVVEMKPAQRAVGRRVHINAHQWKSVVISGNQWQSELWGVGSTSMLISGNQCSSVAISGNQCCGASGPHQ